MNYKKLLIASFICASILTVSPAFSEELQAQVAKSDVAPNVYHRYAPISKMIEYHNYDEADTALKYALKLHPEDIEAQSLRILWMAYQQKLAPAQAELDTLLAKYPDYAPLHYAQGMVYLKRRTSSDVTYIRDSKDLLNDAIKEFVKAVNINGNYYQAYNSMGIATLLLGNKEDAKQLFQTAININPNFANAYDNLGNLELINGNLSEAERYLMQSLKCNSHNPTAMYHLGQVAARQKDYNKALTWLNHSLHINPNSNPALTLQGECYLVQGNQAAAINSFKKAITAKPENTRPYINLANIYEKRSDAEFAIEQLKTAIAINPGYSDAIMRVADLSLEERKYYQALDYYSKLVNDSVYGNDAIVGLANTYYEMSKDKGDSGRFTTNKELYMAYDYINEAIKRVPNRLDFHLAKIKLAKLTHQLPMTKDSINYIIQSTGNSVMDNVIKGEAYLALGRESDAVYTFENAVNFADNVQDELYLAEILVHNKQFRTARTALKKALMQDPNNVIAKNGIAYIDLCETKSNEFFDIAQREYKEGNYASAIEYCNKAIDFYHNSPDITKLKAMSFEKELNYQGAIKYYSQYLQMSPDAQDANYIHSLIERYRQKV
ncbi:MAG: tetratricopeptide repeat protein [Alphaproteobacteria bacterium]|nr:tetratricopeptide repeat protein [Alphaproteobacteria bacterium]